MDWGVALGSFGLTGGFQVFWGAGVQGGSALEERRITMNFWGSGFFGLGCIWFFACFMAVYLFGSGV